MLQYESMSWNALILLLVDFNMLYGGLTIDWKYENGYTLNVKCSWCRVFFSI